MDFKQLKSFAAVVENKSFSKAAEKLNMAQPTISTHIRTLEEELNARLILRTTKSIEITPQGLEAYKYAIKILDLRECILENCSGNARSIIRVGASTIPATYVLPVLLPEYSQIARDTYFVVHQSKSAEVVEGVTEGRFDVGLIGFPVEKEGIICTPFCQNRMVLITPVTDRYLNLQLQRNMSLEMLLKEPIVLREHGSKKTADRFLEAMGIREEELHVVARVNDQEAVKNMVARGMGVSLISEIAARDMIRERRILQFPLPQNEAPQSLYLVRRSRFGTNTRVKEFVEFVMHHEVV